MEVLDLRSGTTRTLQGVSAPTWITSLTFTPDGKSVAGGSFDGDVRVWDVASGSIVHTFVTQTNSFIQVGVDPTGRTVLAGADDGSVVAWDLSGQQGLGQSFAWADPGLTCPAPECFVVNPSSTLMANDLADGTIALVDLRTLKPRGTLPGVGGKVANGLAFLGDDQTLIGGDMGGTITFWDTNSLTARRTLHVPDGVVWLATSPDQKALAVQSQAAGAATSEVRLLDLASGEVTRTYSIASGGAGVIFSPDGRLLAALGCCSAGSAVHVWDARSGAELYHPKLAGQTSSIAFSPTSAVLAGGTADGKLVLWDAHTGTQLGPPIQVSAASVVQISFSPDGHLIAAGSGDGSSILIDASSREQVGNSFPVLQQAVPAPQFEPDGDLLIVYLTNAGRYPTDLQAWERFACQVAGRDLTPAEWSSFLPNRPYQHVCPG
jgi:WD40 repeat protein